MHANGYLSHGAQETVHVIGSSSTIRPNQSQNQYPLHTISDNVVQVRLNFSGSDDIEPRLSRWVTTASPALTSIARAPKL